MTNQIACEKRRICADLALICYGTAYIFEKRTTKIRRKVLFLSFLGIAGPASVGAIISAYKLSPQDIDFVFLIAGSIGFMQLILTIWSLVAGWNQNLSNYLESKATNYRLSKKFNILSRDASLSAQDFEIDFQVLRRDAEFREVQDNMYDITDKEKRMGMRYGLRKYQRKCSGCSQIPTATKATKCDICGNF